ncbi:hypothetical protein SUGI_0239560 [Cryptomeria japonica]|nr:hypothetical protein SUGI_0239560 [Cryptomeria japonica]
MSQPRNIFPQIHDRLNLTLAVKTAFFFKDHMTEQAMIISCINPSRTNLFASDNNMLNTTGNGRYPLVLPFPR